ncbi:MAG: hypothetical protein UHG68_03625 [Clostridia bacterium]|nr:hypothetical protein [Clostridia bacterium]
MGFGILLIGFLLSLSNYPGYTDCAAYFIIFYALLKLGRYNRYFKASKYLSFILTVCGMAGLMLSMGELIGFVDETNTLINIYDNATEAIKIVFHLLLLLGVIDICKQTQLPKYVKTGVWCICIDALYALLYVLSFFAGVFVPFRMLVRLVFMLVTAYLIFNCYRMICLEGDEDMPLYNSRFEIVNKFRRRLEEKAEEGNRKGAEAQQFKQRQAEARKNGVDLSKKFTESKKKK